MNNSPQEIKIPGNIHMPADKFYSIVMDSLQDYSIFTTDQNMIINSWLAGASHIFGYQPEEVIGRHYELIFTKEDQLDNITQLEKEIALREGKATDNRWHVTKDGNQFFAFGLVFPLKDDDDNLLGFVKILRDITAQKKAEEAIKKHIKELEDLNTHKENILAILSHDLRSPLGSIIQISDHLKTSIHEMDQGEVRQMLDILYQASTDELNMLDNLLEWARIKYASEAFSPASQELRQQVNKVYENLGEMAHRNSIRLINEVDEHIQVYADKKMLNSILQNLVSNAIKYNRPGGSIDISASHEGEMVKVMVTDTGLGMSKEQMEKLFTPRLKTLSQARQGDKGAGIGLLLVKGFLEKNGGKINVESIEGERSTFYFTLPANQQAGEKVNADNLEIIQ